MADIRYRKDHPLDPLDVARSGWPQDVCPRQEGRGGGAGLARARARGGQVIERGQDVAAAGAHIEHRHAAFNPGERQQLHRIAALVDLPVGIGAIGRGDDRRMLELLESTSREIVDVKVVPDLLQVIALRARLEDLDGIDFDALSGRSCEALQDRNPERRPEIVGRTDGGGEPEQS